MTRWSFFVFKEAPMFESFWHTYPRERRVGKGAALKKWGTLKPSRELAEKIITALEAQIAWRERVAKANDFLPRWKQTFVPHWKHPSTWLHQQCWLDEIPDVTEKKQTRATHCACCQREEGKYPIAGKLYCLRCYDRTAHPEIYAPKLRVVK